MTNTVSQTPALTSQLSNYERQKIDEAKVFLSDPKNPMIAVLGGIHAGPASEDFYQEAYVSDCWHNERDAFCVMIHVNALRECLDEFQCFEEAKTVSQTFTTVSIPVGRLKLLTSEQLAEVLLSNANPEQYCDEHPLSIGNTRASISKDGIEFEAQHRHDTNTAITTKEWSPDFFKALHQKAMAMAKRSAPAILPTA
ncbi:hypothetical protein ACQU0X_27380 [Pseudovibrio ascidiaceicola]|uniref:hypothetical protein n=1 Tax=Pseudovibrio ascidiaceicola TaxID=285279 RepID=UPI003D36C655